MKVTNPNPCLVNVVVDGVYTRLGPNQSADLPEKAVAALIKTGALVASGGKAKPADSGAKDDGPKAPSDMRAAEIKVELDKLDVEYAGNASTEALRDLYVAKLAESGEQ